MWKAARATSAAPVYFTEFEDYVDGSVLVNNPTLSALVKLEEEFENHGEKLPISIIVSLGTGMYPEEKLGSIDFRQSLFKGFLDKIGNLAELMINAVSSNYIIHQCSPTNK